jgi:hypothetical protein
MAQEITGGSPLQRAAPAAPLGTATGTRPGAANPAFQALLEDLDSRAQSLAQRSDAELDAGALPKAVEDARVSLEQALELKQQLLEAWRASRLSRGEGGS